VSGPRRRMAINTPLKVVGAWSEMTEIMLPTRSWLGDFFEKSSLIILCFSGVYKVVRR